METDDCREGGSEGRVHGVKAERHIVLYVSFTPFTVTHTHTLTHTHIHTHTHSHTHTFSHVSRASYCMVQECPHHCSYLRDYSLSRVTFHNHRLRLSSPDSEEEGKPLP